MIKPLDSLKLLEKNKIVTHLSGSQAYGTNTPESDLDIRGLFLADPINIRTPFFNITECNITTEEDTKYYELTHFMKLLLNNNPNIIETLWIDESDIMFKDSKGCYDLLRSYRSQFLCSKVAFTYSGYAYSQIARMKSHKKWINNPQDIEPPRQIDFISLIQNFTKNKILKIELEDYQSNHRLIPYGNNIFGLYEEDGRSPFDYQYNLNTLFDGDHSDYGSPLMILKFNIDEYKRNHEIWKNYWTWKKNRNPIRSKLEEKYQIDTKHLMHTVRLLRTGYEILDTGIVNVKRSDADELLAIRNGSMSYIEAMDYAEDMDNKIKILYKKTDLPKYPDLTLAANVLLEIQDLMWD
jgi:predicted nucleotidyltransferase